MTAALAPKIETTPGKLTERDLAMFGRIGVPLDLLEPAHIERVSHKDARERFGIQGPVSRDMAGILFPYFHYLTGQRVTARVRRDNPEVEDGQPKNKYMCPYGDRRHLYFPPNAQAKLARQETPIVLVEAEKSALALTAWGARVRMELLAVAMGGCWGWRGRIGKTESATGERVDVEGPLPDLRVCDGRTVYVCLDANAATNSKVQEARAALMRELRKRGCNVSVCSLPLVDGVNGPDDLIAVRGDEAMQAVFEGATANIDSPDTPSGYRLVPLADLLGRPDVPVEYIWEGRLVAGTVSALVAKPKVGKSTLARNLALAVSTGRPFLGAETKQGGVIYLALEERAEDVKRDFAAMGATGKEPIYIHADAVPEAALLELVRLIEQHKPCLVVVDPLFRLARIRDEKAYSDTYAALGPLVDVARASGTHILFTHHAGKGDKADAIDAPLGSTALGGIVSTLILLKRTDAYRTMQTVQRIGTDLAETVLAYDAATRTLSQGGSKADAEQEQAAERILAYLAESGEARSQDDIRDGVEGQTRIIRAALTCLVQSGNVLRSGEGKRGKPFLYQRWFSGSQYISGTREPETEKVDQPRMYTGEKVVPGNSGDAILVPGKLTVIL